jgi:outer membrane protein TolC
MNHFFCKFIIQSYGLTSVGVAGILLSLLHSGQVQAQSNTVPNVTYSVTNPSMEEVNFASEIPAENLNLQWQSSSDQNLISATKQETPFQEQQDEEKIESENEEGIKTPIITWERSSAPLAESFSFQEELNSSTPNSESNENAIAKVESRENLPLAELNSSTPSSETNENAIAKVESRENLPLEESFSFQEELNSSIPSHETSAMTIANEDIKPSLNNALPISACVQPLAETLNVTQLSGDINLQNLIQDLEELYPSANPLFFPTQKDEVNARNQKGITLDQAIELGQQNNRELQVARLNLDRSQEVLQEALAAKYPTLDVEASFTRNDSSSRELSLEASRITNGDTISTTLTTGINLNYDVYTSGRRESQIRIAEEQIKSTQLELERLEEETRLNVTKDYYNLQSADADVGIEQKAVEDATRNLRDTELLEQAGLGTKFDVLRAQVNLADANQRLTRAIAQQRVARRQLTQRLSLGEQIEVFAADKIKESGQWTCTLEESIIKAYRNRSELEQFLVQRTIEEQQSIFEEAALKPQVRLFANYDILGVLDDNLDPADGYQLGVNLQWTLFDGGRAKARSNQNVIDQEIAETQFANQRNQIRFQVEEAYYNLDANQQNIETAASAVILAEESLRLAELRFQAGVGTQTDVINSQTELTRARGNLLRAIIDYNISLATLERSVSNLPDDRLFDQSK